MTTLYHFEDFKVGQRFGFGGYEVTKDEIVAFAQEFDPQPHHLYEEAGRHSILGGLAASGWHVCAMSMRMFADQFANQTASRGGVGVEECRWMKPVRPGDVLHIEMEVEEIRILKSMPDAGIVKLRWNIFNQREQVASLTLLPIVNKRGT
ncbi:MAG TPA: MaoC family dehydratase [Rhizomicrobium sp.]|jgi:acyl dehydratase|nr:MaoC family dehydratase [Rhizomicrobium sp.]